MLAQVLAQRLIDAGLAVLKHGEIDYAESTDGFVDLEHDITIQVGETYTILNVNQYKDGELVSIKHIKDNPSIDEIVQFYKASIDAKEQK